MNTPTVAPAPIGARRFAAIQRASDACDRTKTTVDGFLGGSICTAYRDALKAHHDALVKRHTLIYGPDAGREMRTRTSRMRRAFFVSLAKVS